jgi:hypothetical protein
MARIAVLVLVSFVTVVFGFGCVVETLNGL